MVIWKEYKITDRTEYSGSPNYVKLTLNDWVGYNNGSEKFIYCTNTVCFGNWIEDDKIKIDNEKTKKESKYKNFTFYDSVAFKTTSCYYDKYWEIRREKSSSESNASTRYSNLETERDEWRRKYYDTNRDYQDEKEKREELQEELDRLKNERIRETQANTTDKLRQKETEASLRIERAKAEEKVESAKARELGLTKLLENTKTELSLVRVEKDKQVAIFENKLDQKSALLEQVRQSLKDLEIKSEREKGEKNAEVKEKDSELKEKEKELKRKEEEVKKSQRKVGQSREELLNEKTRTKEEKLKAFANPLGVNLSQINNLRRYYERLIEARKNYNQANIETHEDNIARIEEELSQNEVGINNIQKICRQCEKLAKMRVELNEIRQQQFEARQEVPTNN